MIYSIISKKQIKAKSDGKDYVILNLLSPAGVIAEVFLSKDKYDTLNLNDNAFDLSSLKKADVSFNHKGNIDTFVLVK